MRSSKGPVVLVLTLLALVACSSNRKEPTPENLGVSRQGLLAQGEPCVRDAQCAPTEGGVGHCIDTVCCDTLCGATAADPTGARDNLTCSKVYGDIVDANGNSLIVNGTCTTIPVGQTCGDLVSRNPCLWRGKPLNPGERCPAPQGGDELHACYDCSATGPYAGGCPTGIPVCINGGCEACGGNHGTGALGCPDPNFPICQDDGCVQCTPTDDSLCPGFCVNNTCTNCTASYLVEPQGARPCQAAQPVCLTNGRCGGCDSNDDCTFYGGVDTRTPICNLNTNQCVGCVTGGDCPENAPICSNGTCTNSCDADFGQTGTRVCTQNNPACIDGTCRPCRSAPGATSAAPNLGCNATNFVCLNNTVCVRCDDNADCPASAPVCFGNTCASGCPGGTDAECPAGLRCSNNVCVECTESGHCPPDEPICDPATKTCVDCLTNADCSGTTPICTNGTCGPCNPNVPGQCPGDRPTCIATGPNTGSCGECTTNADCPANEPICSANGTCVPCDGNSGSGAPNACPANLPACKAGTCVECTPEFPNACSGTEPVCNPVNNTCVECTTNSQCAPPLVCNPTSGTCAPVCTTNNDCPVTLPVCAGGVCVECTAQNSTGCKPPEPVCDTATNTCVGCTTSAQCPADKPICNPQSKTCTDTCTADSECPGTAPICNPQTRKCVECTTNAQCTGGRTCDPTGKCVGPDAGVPEAGPVDSGPPRDSGPVDAGPPPLDATPPPVDVFAIEGGGCDCSTTTSRDPSGAAGSALLALGVATVLTRRRRRSGAQL